jgi:hypothetical protein
MSLLCYLAYLLLSLLKIYLNKINISPIEALKELETMYKVYMRDTKKGFNLSRVVTLTKKQETILKSVDKHCSKSVVGKNCLEFRSIVSLLIDSREGE